MSHTTFSNFSRTIFPTVLFCFFFGPAVWAQTRPIAIVGGTLIDGTGRAAVVVADRWGPRAAIGAAGLFATAGMAIMAAGCITTPAYTTNTAGDHAHILGNSGARAAIVSTRKLAKALLPATLLIEGLPDRFDVGRTPNDHVGFGGRRLPVARGQLHLLEHGVADHHAERALVGGDRARRRPVRSGAGGGRCPASAVHSRAPGSIRPWG